MRIIAGIARGHKLVAPKGSDFRPTTDRVRENIFNILGERTKGAIVLDLFCGSGALGIEALSRGAAKATFIDEHQAAVKAVTKNLQSVGFDKRAKVIKMRASEGLKSFKASGKRFNLIFLDPPYKIRAAELQKIFVELSFYLTPEAIAVLEHGNRLAESPTPLFQLIDSRRYGNTFVSFFKLADRD